MYALLTFPSLYNKKESVRRHLIFSAKQGSPMAENPFVLFSTVLGHALRKSKKRAGRLTLPEYLMEIFPADSAIHLVI